MEKNKRSFIFTMRHPHLNEEGHHLDDEEAHQPDDSDSIYFKVSPAMTYWEALMFIIDGMRNESVYNYQLYWVEGEEWKELNYWDEIWKTLKYAYLDGLGRY